MVKIWAIRAASLLAGYAIACLIAAISSFILFAIGIAVMTDRPNAGDAAMLFLFLGTIYVFLTAWPGFVTTQLLVWKRWMRPRPVSFALAGLATAFQAISLFSLFGSMNLMASFWFVYPAGLVAGYAYGLFWRKLPGLSAWLAPSGS